VLRRIFGPKRDEVTGEWRKLHNEELNDLYSSPSTVRVIKSRRMRWAGRVARMKERRSVCLVVFFIYLLILHRLKEERKILHTIKRRKVKWIGHILRRNCVIEGKVEDRMKVTGRLGKRRKQLLDDLKETRDYW